MSGALNVRLYRSIGRKPTDVQRLGDHLNSDGKVQSIMPYVCKGATVTRPFG